MAVANVLIFGGVSTEDYGSYGLVVEGSGDYSAPKRAVETIEIPGRNGAFQLDKGYYENIEVEYSVVVKDATQADFRDAIDSYRNAIVSQIGYQRLEDTYHPNEYRMAMYAGGLDEDPAFHGNGAIFKVKFDCKPQRFLTSGETAIEVDSGDTINNPTPFEASPLLEAWGYGNIQFNEFHIGITDDVFGHIILKDEPSYFSGTGVITFSDQMVNTGDTMMATMSVKTAINAANIVDGLTGNTYTQPNSGRISASTVFEPNTGSPLYQRKVTVQTVGQAFSFTLGTDSTQTDSATAVIGYTATTTTVYTATVNITYSFTYSASENKLTYQISRTVTNSRQASDFVLNDTTEGSFDSIEADSTVSILGNPTYVDCDFGEAYKIENNEYISLNRYIDLGSNLPTLAVGTNEITFDNTITTLKVVPRWWKI